MRRIACIVFVFIALFSIIGIANSKNDFSLFILSILHDIPHLDKLVHCLFVGSITFVLNYSFRNRKVKMFFLQILSGSLLVAIFMTLEEFSQNFIAHRHFEFLDLLSNYAGIFIASYFPIIRRWYRK